MARANEFWGICRFCRRVLVPNLQALGKRRTHKYTHVNVMPSSESNRFATVYRDLHGAVEDNSTARDFVFALQSHERTLLFNELRYFEEDMAKVSQQDTAHLPPTPLQRRQVLVHNAIPFIAFGFLDNFLMITAGEYIDSTFGVVLGISTMAAAALGNWISDLAGVGSAHYVERLTSKCGVKSPALTAEQVDMKQTKWSANMGRAIGISIGCILGMCPLLFFNDDKKKVGETDEESPAGTGIIELVTGNSAEE